jgi:hypothetical protein
MNREFFPDTPPDDATVEVVLELTRAELDALDRARAETGRTREQYARRIFAEYLEQAGGPKG